MKMMFLTLAIATSLLLAGAAQADEALAKGKGCEACHTIDKKLIGPTYKDIAEKYSGQKDSEAQIAHAIINGTPFPGGVGWQKKGKAAMAYMPPKATVKPQEATNLAKWIINLK